MRALFLAAIWATSALAQQVLPPSIGLGSSGITSVNGNTGPAVVLTAAQVGSDPTGTAAGLALTTYSLKSYGATGNNTTDDGTAIQTAINALAAAGGGTLYVPAGHYRHAATLTRPRNVLIQGAGYTSTYFTYTGSTTAWVLGDSGLTGTASSIHGGGLRDLTLYGPGYSTSALGVFMGGDPTGTISASGNSDDSEEWHNVVVSNFGVGARPGNQAYLGYYEGVTFLNNGQHWVDAQGTNAGERQVFVSAKFVQSQSATAPAIVLNNNLGDYFFDGVSIDYNNNAQYDVACTAGTMRAEFVHAHFEKAHGGYIQINSTNCGGSVSIDQSIFTTTNASVTGGTAQTAADPSMISLIGNYGEAVWLSVRDTQVNSNEPVAAFVDASTSNRQITLDSLLWENYNSNLGLGVNAHGNPAGITIRNTTASAGTSGLASVAGESVVYSGTVTAGGFNGPVVGNVTGSLTGNVAGGTGSFTMVNATGTVTVANPTAATSGTTIQTPPAVKSVGSYYTGGIAYPLTETTQFTPGYNLLNSWSTGYSGIPGYNGISRYQFSGINALVEANNLNDSLASMMLETYSTAYFGLDNTSTSTATSVFAMNVAGKVGSVVPATSAAAPNWRDVLDDGSGNAAVRGTLSIGTSTTLSGAQLISFAAAPTGSCTTGSLGLNTAGTTGSTLYVCIGSAWVDVK